MKGVLGKALLHQISNKRNASDGRKYYKINYTLNVLPSVMYVEERCDGDKFNMLMDLFSETEEMDIFSTKVVKDFFDYQWNRYAKDIHNFGAGLHFFYLIIFSMYVNQIYLDRNFIHRHTYCWIMLICLLYPLYYDGLQLYNKGIKSYL